MMVLLGEVVMNVKLVMEMGWMMRLIIEEIVFDERSFLKIVHTFGLGWYIQKKFFGPKLFWPKAQHGYVVDLKLCNQLLVVSRGEKKKLGPHIPSWIWYCHLLKLALSLRTRLSYHHNHQQHHHHHRKSATLRYWASATWALSALSHLTGLSTAA